MKRKLIIFILLFLQLIPQVWGFQSFDEDDERGALAYKNYHSFLRKGTGSEEKNELTEEAVKVWLTSTHILTDKEKENLQVTEKTKELKDKAAHSAQLFSINTSARNFFLKIWDSKECLGSLEEINVRDKVAEKRAKNTYMIKKWDLIKKFNASSNFPHFAVDEWAGSYEGSNQEKRFLNLMTYARGIPLSDYLENKGESEHLLVVKQLGKVFGNLHAHTLLELNEEYPTLKTSVGFPDCLARNIFFNAESEEITFIDLDSIGRTLNKGAFPLEEDLKGILFYYLSFSKLFENNSLEQSKIIYDRIKTFIEFYSSPFGDNQQKIRKVFLKFIFLQGMKTIMSGKKEASYSDEALSNFGLLQTILQQLSLEFDIAFEQVTSLTI